MRLQSCVSVLAMAALLAGCGGSGGGVSGGTVSVAPTPSPTPAPTPSPTPTPTPTTATAGCSLLERQNWAAAQLREWYLFPELLTNVQPAAYSTVDAYIDGLTATARAQRKDRFFTYLTSIAQENAFYASGQTAGFGFRLATNSAQGRVFVTESFENTPALNAGLDRGTEILAIGTSEANLRTVSSILASEGGAGVTNALGPNTVGTARVFRVTDAAGTRVVTAAKADYELVPVSTRYGARVLDDGGKKVGYVNMRSFISTADPALKSAFANFRAQGISEVVIDLRYNGGGLVSIAQLFGDLMGRNRAAGSDVFNYLTFNAAKSSENETRFFQARTDSIAPTKIAFIGMSGTASASELLMNAFIPYLRTNTALIGTNTFGKPVGQIALDRGQCDDRLRVMAFATQNAERQGDYYDGMKAVMPRTCAAQDDVGYALGDARENSIKVALDFLAGRSCTAIAGVPEGASARSASGGRMELLTPDRPTTAQREVPGLF